MAATGTQASGAVSAASVMQRLDAVRDRTLLLVEQISDDTLNAVHSPLMSPIVWDLGHIATFEDLWLAQATFGLPMLREALGQVYDPNAAPRSERGDLPFLRSEDAFRYMGEVRARTLELLDGADLSPSGDRLLRDGFVFDMVLRHEQQHTETILQTLQLMTSDRYDPPRRQELAGRHRIGASGPGFAYDNERPAHVVEVSPFLIDRAPVANGAFGEFIEDGGYARPECW